MLAKQGIEDIAKRVEALGRKVSLHLTDVSVRVQGLLALHSQTSYVASKFAVRGFGESLRGEDPT